MEIKTYKTSDKRYPWRAEDSNGNYVDAASKDAAISMLKLFYEEVPQQTSNVANESRWAQ